MSQTIQKQRRIVFFEATSHWKTKENITFEAPNHYKTNENGSLMPQTIGEQSKIAF